VPSDDPTEAYSPITSTTNPPRTASSLSASSTGSISSHATDVKHAGERYSNKELRKSKSSTKIFRVSPAVILNHLMRKTIRKNTWIFVADTSFRLYVGIKESGAFQHSSFLHGAKLSAAGLIEIRDGLLISLSPLSGHYRPPASNFRDFVQALKDRHVDMSHVSISKSYAVLVGLETYASGKRKLKQARNAVTKMKGRHDDEPKTLDGNRTKSQDIALKEEHEGGLDDRRSVSGTLKDLGVAAPILPKQVVPTINLPFRKDTKGSEISDDEEKGSKIQSEHI
jgi:hypothetical protein